MTRNTSGLKRGGGRTPGVPNKATTEAKEVCARMVDDPAYRAKLMERLTRGKLAPAVECMLWHYAKGKPKETTVLENPDGSSIGPLVQFYLPQNQRNVVST